MPSASHGPLFSAEISHHSKQLRNRDNGLIYETNPAHAPVQQISQNGFHSS